MKTWALLMAAAMLAGCAPAAAPPARDYSPTITRDAYGVPTIHAADDAEAAYGVAYAHAEDNFATIQLVVLAARGRLGAHLGEEGARSDFLWHLLGVREAVQARYEHDLSEDMRAVMQGYADGLNAYAAEHPDEVLPGARNVTGRDVAAGSALTLPLFWGFERTLGLVAERDSAHSEVSAVVFTLEVPEGMVVVGEEMLVRSLLGIGSSREGVNLVFHCATGPQVQVLRFRLVATRPLENAVVRLRPDARTHDLAVVACKAEDFRLQPVAAESLVVTAR